MHLRPEAVADIGYDDAEQMLGDADRLRDPAPVSVRELGPTDTMSLPLMLGRARIARVLRQVGSGSVGC